MTEPAHLADTRHAYDTVARDYATLLPGLTVETTLDVAVLDDFIRRCHSVNSGPVADIGCGAGRVSTYLAVHGLDVTGFDLSPQMIDTARSAHPDLPFHVASLDALPLPDANLTGILAWYSIIHTPPGELSVVAGECARVLEPGGHLLVAFQSGTGERVERASGYGHVVDFVNYRHDPDHLTTILGEADLDVLVRLDRAAVDHERTPQCLILARKRS
ncbi:MAG: class I SAM-dependent methyltransferase [Janthinobacterium lividum]